MSLLQQSFLLLFALFCFAISIKGFLECRNCKNAYGDTRFLYPLSIYVWGDALVFGLFWGGAALASIVLQDWILFWLTASLFWLVRSIGETFYWFLQQYSSINKNPPKNYWLHKIYRNDSVWFAQQIINQCLTVVTIITSMYLAKLWLAKF